MTLGILPTPLMSTLIVNKSENVFLRKYYVLPSINGRKILFFLLYIFNRYTACLQRNTTNTIKKNIHISEEIQASFESEIVLHFSNINKVPTRIKLVKYTNSS